MKRLLGICCVFAWLLSGCGAKASVTKPSQSTTHTDRTATSSHTETTSSQNATLLSTDASSSVESTTTTTVAPTTTTITSTTTTTISSTTTTHTTSTFPSTTVSSHTTTSTATTPTSSTTTILTRSSYSTTSITTTTTTTKPTASIDTTTTESVGMATISPTTKPATTTSTTISTAITTSNVITFKVTIRDDNRRPVSGVTVSVWKSADCLLGHAVTNQNGVAQISLQKSSSYRVKLSNLPMGYEADPEYRFSGSTVNINIRKVAVRNEADHSEAQYKVGQTMTDFTLTDTDGNIYRLSDLLKTNQLIVLDFWFATCEPCKGEFPFFEAAVQKYGGQMTLLAVNPIDSMSVINALRNRYNANPDTALSFPMVKDTCNLHLGFDVVSYPTTVFIDSNGQIVDIHLDAYTSEAAFLAAIEHYLH